MNLFVEFPILKLVIPDPFIHHFGLQPQLGDGILTGCRSPM